MPTELSESAMGKQQQKGPETKESCKSKQQGILSYPI